MAGATVGRAMGAAAGGVRGMGLAATGIGTTLGRAMGAAAGGVRGTGLAATGTAADRSFADFAAVGSTGLRGRRQKRQTWPIKGRPPPPRLGRIPGRMLGRRNGIL
jgi:hypothetical protein